MSPSPVTSPPFLRSSLPPTTRVPPVWTPGISALTFSPIHHISFSPSSGSLTPPLIRPMARSRSGSPWYLLSHRTHVVVKLLATTRCIALILHPRDQTEDSTVSHPSPLPFVLMPTRCDSNLYPAPNRPHRPRPRETLFCSGLAFSQEPGIPQAPPSRTFWEGYPSLFGLAASGGLEYSKLGISHGGSLPRWQPIRRWWWWWSSSSQVSQLDGWVRTATTLTMYVDGYSTLSRSSSSTDCGTRCIPKVE